MDVIVFFMVIFGCVCVYGDRFFGIFDFGVVLFVFVCCMVYGVFVV